MQGTTKHPEGCPKSSPLFTHYLSELHVNVQNTETDAVSPSHRLTDSKRRKPLNGRSCAYRGYAGLNNLKGAAGYFETMFLK